MKKAKIFLFSFFIVSFFSFLSGQQLQTGSIKGTVSDPEGTPLPGVAITVKGPSLIGSQTGITSGTGSYRIAALPPGTYVVTAELNGFSILKREGVIVRVGMVVEINIQLAPSPLKEEVIVAAPSPVVDMQSSKIATLVSSEIMENLPLNRNLSNIIATTPGTIGTVMHGGVENSNAYEIDGVNVNDPDMYGRFVTVQFDAMEEAEIQSGGLPAQVGNTSGSFINVVTKSGGNNFHGQVQAYYSNESMTKILFPDYQLKAMGMGKPSAPIYSYDFSGILGGPIIKDKLWFFADVAADKSKVHSPFIPTVILGESYDQYPLTDSNVRSFLKLTTQISKSLRFFVMGVFSENNQPYSLWLAGSRNTAESLIAREHVRNLTFSGNLTWLLSSNTFVDFRAGLTDLKMPQPYSVPGTENNPHYYDAYTGYNWGSPFRMNEYVHRGSKQASIRLTHFQDNVLGGNHEFRAGVEIQTGLSHWAWWRQNPMHWQYYNGNPYYYRGLYGLTGPDPVFGDGYLWFAVCGPQKDDTYAEGDEIRFGSFIQDSWTIKNRLTINLGLRFDSYHTWIPEETKAAATGIAEAIGAYYLEPVYGFNPFGQLTLPKISNMMGWSPLSPRVGLVYDLFGNGKTALKASYSRYAEELPIMYFNLAHPFAPRTLGFYWWDLNSNGVPDAPPIDAFENTGGSPQQMNPSYYQKTIAKDIKPPSYDEFTVSIAHELVRDFNVSLQYIYRKKKNIVDTVLWDPTSGKTWNTYERAAEWWIPFTTIVPAYGDFPEQKVTMYMMSLDAPSWFTQFANVPEARRKYQALELALTKRFSKGWMLGGSVVLSKTEGDNSEAHGAVYGYGGAYDQANWFVNAYGRTPADRPLVIKLYGSFELPLRFIASFYYTHFDGAPWARTVTVFPPSPWAATNNTNLWSWTVNVETPGARRYPATDNVDFRIEKEFDFAKYGKVGFFLDVYNLLGSTYVSIAQNPGGSWFPSDENTDAGRYVPDAYYGRITGVNASRTYKLSVRYTF
jgi:hypothetical protein